MPGFHGIGAVWQFPSFAWARGTGYAGRMQICTATPADAEAIWTILEPVIRACETYALDRDMSREAALSYWLASEAFVAEEDGSVIGTYYLRRNQAGRGAHVCNCGYMVSATAS